MSTKYRGGISSGKRICVDGNVSLRSCFFSNGELAGDLHQNIVLALKQGTPSWFLHLDQVKEKMFVV